MRPPNGIIGQFQEFHGFFKGLRAHRWEDLVIFGFSDLSFDDSQWPMILRGVGLRGFRGSGFRVFDLKKFPWTVFHVLTDSGVIFHIVFRHL